MTEDGVSRAGVSQETRIILPSIVAFDFASDTEAANNGIPIGGIYHFKGDLKIRLV